MPSLEFTIRPARATETEAITRLVVAAFAVWKERGLDLSPMRQTPEQTAASLDRTFVAEGADGALLGTFCLEPGDIRASQDGRLAFVEGSSAPVDFSHEAAAPAGPFSVFKKAAVRPEAAHRGVGARLFQAAVEEARDGGCRAMALETVAEADWLYAWYARLGFVPLGRRRYPGSAVQTILMAAPLSRFP